MVNPKGKSAIITDNGSNMVSAFPQEEEDTSSDEDVSQDSDDDEEPEERLVCD